MHPTQAHIDTLPEAYEVIKSMSLNGDWGADLSRAARDAVAEIIEKRMDVAIDCYLERTAARGEEDRRNGHYDRHLLTSLGDLELNVPRTRKITASAIIGAYRRRAPEVDRAVLSCFVMGCSTRKVSKALVPMLGESVSATTVSNVAKSLDAAVKAFHKRPLQNRYRVLVFDGVVLSRKTGAGALKRPVLVVLGLLEDGRKEVIDFRLAKAESEREWETFLSDMAKRGLTGEGVELVGSDGGSGLIAALGTVYPGVPHQRCWAHKMRNLTDGVREADHEEIKRGLRKIYRAKNEPKARQAARRFATRWEAKYPKVVRSLRNDLDELLAFFVFKDPTWRKWTRTTNAIERRFREVRRRTRPMGVFTDRTSMDRILLAVFTHENKQQRVSPLFPVTHKT